VADQELEGEHRRPGRVAAAGAGERRVDIAETAEDLGQLLVKRFMPGKAAAGLAEAGSGLIERARAGQGLGEE
jgi:hypothetical protein